MLWANALHDMSLNMVLSKATSLGTAPGPIPDLRFVKATVVMKSRPDSVRLKDWLGFCALVERLLSTDDFVKYVCNGTPQPIDLASDEKHHNAVFLCFLQHVQYHFTKAKAFVSDYQGTFDSPDSHCQGLSYVRRRLLVDRSAGHGKIRVCQTSFSNRTALILFQSCGTSAFCGWKC